MLFLPPDAALWERLRILDAICDIDLHRGPASHRMFPGVPRLWSVSIRASRVPGARIWDATRGHHPALSEALNQAIEEAEAQGWHTPTLRLRSE